jgi:hypothetical protein
VLGGFFVVFALMAVFGHSSTIIISTSNVEASTEAWNALGFATLPPEEFADSRLVRLFDGQVRVTLFPFEFRSPALARFTASLDRVLQRCRDKEIPVNATDRSNVVAPGPGGLDVYLHQQRAQNIGSEEKRQNPVLGYADVLLVRVADVAQARQWAERAGFLVESVSQYGPLRVDMTDGVSRIGFLLSDLEGRELIYTTTLDDELVSDLVEAFGKDAHVHQHADGSASMVRLHMPEGTWITVVADDEE